MFLGEALLYSGVISRADSHLKDVQFEGGRFEYVSHIREPGVCEDGEHDCVDPFPDIPLNDISGCCDDTTNEYVRSFGWKEVDISAVPSGTPLVDGRIQTYKLMFY